MNNEQGRSSQQCRDHQGTCNLFGSAVERMHKRIDSLVVQVDVDLSGIDLADGIFQVVREFFHVIGNLIKSVKNFHAQLERIEFFCNCFEKVWPGDFQKNSILSSWA